MSKPILKVVASNPNVVRSQPHANLTAVKPPPQQDAHVVTWWAYETNGMVNY
jgi:hypothetical protein